MIEVVRVGKMLAIQRARICVGQMRNRKGTDMTLGLGVRIGMRLLGVLFACGGVFGSEQEEQVAIQAELKMLRNAVVRQTKELEQLRAENAAMKKELEALRPARETAKVVEQPVKAVGQAVKPAEQAIKAGERKVRNVLFVVGTSEAAYPPYHHARQEILHAIEQLPADQSFNVLLRSSKGVVVMQKGNFVVAGPENHHRATQFLNAANSGYGCLEDALRYAINWRPDVICLLYAGTVKDVDAALKTVREHNVGPRIPINSSLKHCSDPASAHLLWQLAKESGGICTASEGKAADEPVVPVVVAPAKKEPEAPKPTVFQIK